jgi:hypothetical protein
MRPSGAMPIWVGRLNPVAIWDSTKPDGIIVAKAIVAAVKAGSNTRLSKEETAAGRRIGDGEIERIGSMATTL